MDSLEVTHVRQRFLRQIRELAAALKQCGATAHIFVIPTEPAWPTFFVGPNGQEGVCQGVNTRPADDAYESCTAQRRADVAHASIQA